MVLKSAQRVMLQKKLLQMRVAEKKRMEEIAQLLPSLLLLKKCSFPNKAV